MSHKPLDIPALLKEEFGTVALVWKSNCSTRALDALILSWVKYEKQLRRLFFHIACSTSLPKLMDSELEAAIIANKSLYSHNFIAGIEDLSNRKMADIVGDSFTKLDQEMCRIQEFRHKLIHGQLTGKKLNARQLERKIGFVINWIEALAEGARSKFEFDGIVRGKQRRKRLKTTTSDAQIRFSDIEGFVDWLCKLSKKKPKKKQKCFDTQ